MEPAELPARNGKGRYLPGRSGNPAAQWQKGQSGNTGGMAFVTHCLEMLQRYELVEEVALIAKGHGKYAKAALSDRLRAFELLCDRALGKPGVTDLQGKAYQETQLYCKRLIGVSLDDI